MTPLLLQSPLQAKDWLQQAHPYHCEQQLPLSFYLFADDSQATRIKGDFPEINYSFQMLS